MLPHCCMTSQVIIKTNVIFHYEITFLNTTLLQSSSIGQTDGDERLSSRYLTPVIPSDDSNQPSFSIDDFLASHNGPADQDFDPGNRLEASGFNADDVSALVSFTFLL